MNYSKNKIISIYNKVYLNHKNFKNNSVHERILKLKKLKKNILEYRTEIKNALKEDFNKNGSEVDLTEIFPVVSELNHSINNLKKWVKRKYVKTPITLIGSKSYIEYEAKGIVLIITPWNFPINLTFVSLISAISANNSVIVKPSEITNKTSLIIKKIIESTFDHNNVSVVLGGADTASNLLKLKFDHILFIGSPTIGKIVMKSAAKNLSSITLELGGKSPTIIDKGSNLNDAAKKLTWSKFINNGQVCISPDYVLVHEKEKKRFIKLVIKNIIKFYSNDSINSSSYCRIVNENHFRRVKELIENAKLNGGNILYGGKTKKEKNYIEPTLIDNISENSKIYNQEIFGPILPIYTFNKISDSISFINKKEKPLALYIFSNNKRNIKKVLEETSSGGVCVNHSTLHYSNYNLPFGGIGNSGFGKCHGIYGFKEFSNQKSVLKQFSSFSPTDLLLPPYNRFKQNLIDIIIKYF
ncbi:MAG: aldehyde dehydrogenase family protein [Cytophagia bacterium]|jgi:aldehyde dehydrogenase (NAD+)|nr:aldehyde dehydrogenase family protein [Cytophagia bacterium]|tara:strand:- start:1519 stop:2928 length:1410 start_codon:yes stop_codon:yes gene_type:complete